MTKTPSKHLINKTKLDWYLHNVEKRFCLSVSHMSLPKRIQYTNNLIEENFYMKSIYENWKLSPNHCKNYYESCRRNLILNSRIIEIYMNFLQETIVGKNLKHI